MNCICKHVWPVSVSLCVSRVQDDIVMGMLTVHENIEFSAALRLPRGTTSNQRREKVDEVIADLGLSACANTRVGFLAVYDATLCLKKFTSLVCYHISSRVTTLHWQIAQIAQ